MKFRKKFTLRKPAGEGGEQGGATEVDRGDNYTPPVEAPAPAPAAPPPPAPAAAAPPPAAEGAREAPGAIAAEEEGEAGDAGKKGKAIPLDRHQAILAKERERTAALERELQATRQGQELAKAHQTLAEAETGIAAMEKEYIELLEKGDKVAATAKMAEIRLAERKISDAQADTKAAQAEARAYARVKYETTVERLEAAFPAINPDHADFDADLANEVVELRDAYLATNKYSSAEALQKAVAKLIRPETKKQEAATTVDVRVTEKDVAEELRAERKGAAVQKAIDASGKQPPSAAGVGQDSDKAGGKLTAQDVMKMKPEQFAKLSETDLAALRGDSV